MDYEIPQSRILDYVGNEQSAIPPLQGFRFGRAIKGLCGSAIPDLQPVQGSGVICLQTNGFFY